jgi:hypothetical protein
VRGINLLPFGSSGGIFYGGTFLTNQPTNFVLQRVPSLTWVSSSSGAKEQNLDLLTQTTPLLVMSAGFLFIAQPDEEFPQTFL